MKPSLVALGLATILSSCAASTSVVKEDSPTELTETASAVEPDLEGARANSCRKDLFDRVVEFGGAIKEEVAAGQLKLRLSPLPEEVEHLNATYMPSTEAGSPVITIECQPKFEKCFTGAFEHEVGHHIYKSLTEEQRAKIDAAVAHRLNEPDAQAFREKIARLDHRSQELSKLLAEAVTPLAECQRLRKCLSFGERFLSKLGQEGISYPPELAEKLKVKAEIYSSYMPTCTPENLRQAQDNFSQVEKQVESLIAAQIKQIYHQNQNLPAEASSSNGRIAFSLEPVSEERLGDFDRQGWEYMALITSYLDQRLGELTEVCREGEVLSQLTEKAMILDTSYTFLSLGLGVSSFQLTLSSHDSRAEEQFAAVVDSLADGYIGPIVTAPMKVQLDEPLLQELEQVEYKGQQVLASLVEKYRLKLEEGSK